MKICDGSERYAKTVFFEIEIEEIVGGYVLGYRPGGRIFFSEKEDAVAGAKEIFSSWLDSALLPIDYIFDDGTISIFKGVKNEND